MSKFRELMKAMAGAYRTELDHYEMAAWEKDCGNYPEGDLREAFARHRRDIRPTADGQRLRGEFWPGIAVILSRLAEINSERMETLQRARGKCANPECSSGWVPVNIPGQKAPSVRRCPNCKPHQVAS